MTPLDYIKDGAEIYRRSFATIRREAELSRFSPLEERIAVRIIHACGQVEIAADIVFTPGAADAASGHSRAASSRSLPSPYPSAWAPMPSPRIMAVQRVLSNYGYGQIKLSGMLDDPTSQAIEKFEREHKLPVSGRLSDRLVNELAAMTGHPIE